MLVYSVVSDLGSWECIYVPIDIIDYDTYSDTAAPAIVLPILKGFLELSKGKICLCTLNDVCTVKAIISMHAESTTNGNQGFSSADCESVD